MTSKFAHGLAALSVQIEKPARMIVRGFDGKPMIDDDGLQHYVDLHSGDSEIAKRHRRSITNQRIEARGAKVTAEQIDDNVIDLYVKLTAGWGTIDKAGMATPDADFSPDLAHRIYGDDENAELLAQVDAFIGARVNFKKASPKV